MKLARIFLLAFLFSFLLVSCRSDGGDVSYLTDDEQTMDAPQLRRELNEARQKHKRVLRKFAITAYVVNFGAVALWLVLSYKRKKRKQEHYFNIAENVKELVDVKNEQNEQMAKLMRELLTREYKAIDEKCRDYYSNSSAQSRRKVSDEVVAMIERFSSAGMLAELEQTVNRYQTDVMARFREDLPSLKAADYQLLVYSILGFSTSAISVFLREEKLDAVYNRKARLKAKIKKLPDEDARTKYLSYL